MALKRSIVLAGLALAFVAALALWWFGPQQQTAVPVLTTVMVVPGGEAIVAGRAEPDAEVFMMLDGEAIDRDVAAANGEFVFSVRVPPSDETRVLTVQAKRDGALAAASEPITLLPVEAD